MFEAEIVGLSAAVSSAGDGPEEPLMRHGNGSSGGLEARTIFTGIRHIDRHIFWIVSRLQQRSEALIKYTGITVNQLIGYTFILIVALVWVAASFIVQEIVSDGIPPFVLTYICNSMFVLYLPVVEFGSTWAFLTRITTRGAAGDDADEDTLLEEVGAPDSTEPPEVESLPRYTRYETARAALIICPIWFMAQYTFNVSLAMTSVTANTILSSLATLFTFLLSVAVLKEQFTFRKLTGVALCIIGTTMVTVRDSSGADGHESSIGDLMTLVSAMLYAVYTVALRKMLPDDERISTALFFGYVGLFNLVFLAPVLMFQQFSGKFNIFNLSERALRLTVLKGLFDNVFSDYLWVRAVLLVGPTVASAGMAIQVPIAIFVEILIGHADWIHQYVSASLMIGGGITIVSGFLAVSTQPFVPEDKDG
mmetsp:Transcript_42545/g.70997  ORF Transcript_42545/g.70997 Transcript_42545/m.70997 type:complete len:422 (-) Transcript_42545:50-1315(-)|eukprot:CAMPEP_0198207372 /NCGR_PEP_ID=MMETSP1445-20131203/10828_1 /TAXON_ID=36898 /ORGANISM="Pyramimonas sp., Strain CCMP2087" /LENGTH=421 /DNA_ID=CAMNT_0043880375 /DNA_START=453 /DNA_END=1718 /DNA_ORIENTATION=+